MGDAPMSPELLSQIPPGQEIASLTPDGASDRRKCHDAHRLRRHPRYAGKASDPLREVGEGAAGRSGPVEPSVVARTAGCLSRSGVVG